MLTAISYGCLGLALAALIAVEVYLLALPHKGIDK
jgi:hypothetical protein